MSSQLTFFFKDSFGYGWAEHYFYAGPVSFPNIPLSIQQLMSNRMALSTKDVVLEHIRLGSSIKKNPIIYTVNGGAGLVGSQPTPSAPTEVAVECRFAVSAPQFGFGRVFVRGIPLRVVTEDTFTPDSSYTFVLNSYLNQISGSGVFNVQGTLGSSPTRYPMTANIPTLPRGFTSTITGIPVLAIGSQIRVHAAKIPGFGGIKTVTQVFTTPFSYAFGGAAPPAPDTSPAISASVLTRYDNPITVAQVIGLTRRAPGRPFGLSRGRRQTLLSLRQ